MAFSAPFRSENRALRCSYVHCFRVLRNGRWSVMWSAGISVESYARLASRVYSRGDRFLYGYYNSEQHLIQVKICTAVDKEKGNYEKARRKLKTCNKKLINAEISVFFCRKLLMFGVECGIMIFNDTMY